ncbi:hypothetical protein G9A89_015690 [Geosiphon pyriformis]|nr:hypothetical protein G9A89_015690 [Geosiphon pyriformis]
MPSLFPTWTGPSRHINTTSTTLNDQDTVSPEPEVVAAAAVVVAAATLTETNITNKNSDNDSNPFSLQVKTIVPINQNINTYPLSPVTVTATNRMTTMIDPLWGQSSTTTKSKTITTTTTQVVTSNGIIATPTTPMALTETLTNLSTAPTSTSENAKSNSLISKGVPRLLLQQHANRDSKLDSICRENINESKAATSKRSNVIEPESHYYHHHHHHHHPKRRSSLLEIHPLYMDNLSNVLMHSDNKNKNVSSESSPIHSDTLAKIDEMVNTNHQRQCRHLSNSNQLPSETYHRYNQHHHPHVRHHYSYDQFNQNIYQNATRSTTLTRNVAAAISVEDLYNYAGVLESISSISEEKVSPPFGVRGVHIHHETDEDEEEDEEEEEEEEDNFSNFNSWSPHMSRVDSEEEESVGGRDQKKSIFHRLRHTTSIYDEDILRGCSSSSCSSSSRVMGNNGAENNERNRRSKKYPFRRLSLLGSITGLNKEHKNDGEQYNSVDRKSSDSTRKTSRMQRFRRTLTMNRNSKSRREIDTECKIEKNGDPCEYHAAEYLAADTEKSNESQKQQTAESSKEENSPSSSSSSSATVVADVQYQCTCRPPKRGYSQNPGGGRRSKFFSPFTVFSQASASASTPSLSSITNHNDQEMSSNSMVALDEPNLSASPFIVDERNIIRRSWSHMEVRHLRNLFDLRKVYWREIRRRNSYAYTNSTQTKEQLAAESEIRAYNRTLNREDPTHDYIFGDIDGDDLSYANDEAHPPFDLFEFQAQVEKATDVTSRSQQMRRFKAFEIYSSEYSYLQHLKTLKKLFMDPCYQAAKKPAPTMNPVDVPIMFAHIIDLIRLSNKLLHSLAKVQPWLDADCRVGEVFLKYGKEFEIFQRYAENHQASRAAVQRADQKVLYRKFIQESQRTKDRNRLDLSDYLIMPIQRITRYKLLLQELKNHTTESHPDYEDLTHALENFSAQLLGCNSLTNLHPGSR